MHFAMPTLRIVLVVLTCAVIRPSDGQSGGMAVRDADTLTWGDGDREVSLILARVSDVGEIDPATRWCSITIRPMATLSGAFDAGRNAELATRFHFVNSKDYPIKRIPVPGEAVMALERRQGDHYLVEANFCSFMPSGSPLVTVRGPNDPLVRDVLATIQEERSKAATRPAAESDLTLIRHGSASFGERLRIATTSTDAKVLNLLADFDEPFEVQLLVVMNFATRAGIVKAYTDLPQDVIDRFEHSEHEILRAAAEWNLANRPDSSTRPATRPADAGD